MTGAEEYLERIPLWASKKNSLDAVRDFLEELGSPDKGMRIIHVAGTNGKGSVCQYLTSVLCHAGFRVGTFVSPHLENIRERFLICKNPVEPETFEKAFVQVRSLAEKMAKKGYAPPTYFEFLFYMFMAMMKTDKPDFVVLETGLGGRLDVTNVVREPVLTILTSISMDHMQYLGDTIEKIGAEKAGILKKNVPVVYDDSCQESRGIVEKRAKELGCPRFPVSSDDYVFVKREKEGTYIKVETCCWGKILLEIPSQAEYQMMNATVAVRALDVLAGVLSQRESDGRKTLDRLSEICKKGENASGRRAFKKALGNWVEDGGDGILQGIRKSFWPGRMEQVLEGVFLDGAHNVGGVEALNRTIRRMQKETKKQVSIMFGAVSDKDHDQMIRSLCDQISIAQVTIAHMDTKRSADCEELEEEFKQTLNCPIKVFPEVGQAWEYFLRTRKDSLAFCAGSLYLIGEVKGLLDNSSGTKPVEASDFKGGS